MVTAMARRNQTCAGEGQRLPVSAMPLIVLGPAEMSAFMPPLLGRLAADVGAF